MAYTANGHPKVNSATANGSSDQKGRQPTESAPSEGQRQQTRRLAKFYENKNVLITGVTGFVGKVCLVKLVSSFENCGKVFVMLRPKKGQSAQQRFNQLLNEDPFKQPTVNGRETSGSEGAARKQVDWSKVVAVEGDLNCEDLGFAPEVKETLCKSVNVVFNIAASVQFDAPLKQNLRDNYLGTQNLLHLVSKFENLVSVVHVSTFYTNTHIKHVEEKVIPMNRDCEKMAELISWIPDSLCDSIGPQIMENRPNTYVFTKAMAENLVQKYQGRMPVAIVRPSIVTPSVREPTPGWVDNVNGPMGLGVLASLGILRNIDWNYYGVSDMIPVDYVVNTMLVVAERTARLYPNEIKVYNCSTSSLRPITWGEGFEILRKESFEAPPYKMIRVPIQVPRHRRANKIGFALTKLSELLFAYLVDFILMICGQKQLLTKLTSKLHHGYEILKPFTTNEYTCSNDNLISAYEELDPEEQREFDFDVRKIDWNQAFKDAYYGARVRILKEDLSNVPAAKLKFKILQVVEFVFKTLFWSFLAWTVLKCYAYFSHKALLSF
mgnify:CR=1 FL=1